MSTIAPSRPNDLSNPALLRELANDSFTSLTEEIAKRVASYQNGSPPRSSARRPQAHGA